MKESRAKKALRVLAAVAYLSGLASLAFGLSLGVPAPRPASAAVGAIWTTLNTCGDPEQNINEFKHGDKVYINGSNFGPGTYAWDITGTPGSKCDPSVTVVSGSILIPDDFPTYPSGDFCFWAYEVQLDDCGVYKYGVGGKNDNYHVTGLGALEVTKTANPTSVPETGGLVTFTITVDNPGGDDLRLDSLIDDKFGDLDGQGTCSVPQTIAALGGSYTCTFDKVLTGVPGTPHVDVVTATGTTGSGNDQETLVDTDDATVNFTDVVPEISVVKTANPTSLDEPGGDVDFTVRVNNDGVIPVSLDSLIDTVFSNLNGQGSCSLPQSIPVGGFYECGFTAPLIGEPATPHYDVVTATATGAGDTVTASDDATVTFNDLEPTIDVVKSVLGPSVRPVPGGEFTFEVVVTNLSDEAVELISLTDDIYGDLNGQGTCAIGATLAASGGSYTCSFAGLFESQIPGDSQTDIVTAIAVDNDGSQASDTDDATVSIQDVLPSILVEKSANPTSVPETGGDVDYTVRVTNTYIGPLELVSLIDDMFGPLLGGLCPAPVLPILPGEFYECTFTIPGLSGQEGTSHINTVEGTAIDPAGGPPAVDSDDATVDFTDVLPDIDVDKSASPTSVPETGGDVTFSVTVTNNNSEEVTLDSLIDDVFGDLSLKGDCAVGGTIAGNGGTYSCSFTEIGFSGDPTVPHENTVTATASDDDGNSDTASDPATVDFEDVLPDITVVKEAAPTEVPENGDDVIFTVTVTNNAIEDVTLDSLIDDVFGDLDGQGDCDLPQTLAASGGDYSCSFTAFVSGEPASPHTDIVTASASDDDGNSDTDTDDATVNFTDITPEISVVKTADPTLVPETGDDVDYTVLVTNHNAEAVTLDSLVDDIYGDLNGQGDCSVPQTLAASGGTYSCTFTKTVSGAAGDVVTDVVTAQASDNDGNSDTASDDADVEIQDVVPSIAIEKTADPVAVPESGGDVTFTVVVTNDGSVGVTLTSLTDDVFGDLNGKGDCAVPQSIAPLASYSCSFTEPLSGAAGTSHIDTATAQASDIDGNTLTVSDDATVDFLDELPEITVDKTRNRDRVLFSGEDVTYSVVVTNLSPEEVELLSLIDNKFGDLNGVGTCSVPQTLAPSGEAGDSYACSFTKTISGVAGRTHRNVVTATGEDDDQNQVQAADDATVRFYRPGPTPTPPPIIPVTGVDLMSRQAASGSLFRSLGFALFGFGLLLHGLSLGRRFDE